MARRLAAVCRKSMHPIRHFCRRSCRSETATQSVTLFPKRRRKLQVSSVAMERTPHILVVDDHRDIRDLLARFLTKHGFRASVAESAAAARKAMQAADIDLVVLDIMMP